MNKINLLPILIILVLALPYSQAAAQDDELNALDYMPPSQFITGWAANGDEVIARPLNAAWLLGDDLELLLEFDLQWYATETYLQGLDEMVIEIFQFNSSSDAFGFYNLSYIEPPDQDAVEVIPPYGSPPAANIETIRRVTYGDEEFIEAYQDKFYFRIRSKEEYLNQSGIQAALWIIGRLPGFATQAGFLGILPYESRVVGTERYILGPVGLEKIMPTYGDDIFGNFEFPWSAAAAEYRAGGGEYYLLIGVEFDDSDTASAMRGSLMDYYSRGAGYEPLRLRPFASGTIPYGYHNENYIAIWSEGKNLWLIWDATDLDALLTAIDQQ